MIFVYPALCSAKADRRIVPAICKALERFYLIHIAEAFVSGDLRVKTLWQPSKDVYGPLLLESKKNQKLRFVSEMLHYDYDHIEFRTIVVDEVNIPIPIDIPSGDRLKNLSISDLNEYYQTLINMAIELSNAKKTLQIAERALSTIIEQYEHPVPSQEHQKPTNIDEVRKENERAKGWIRTCEQRSKGVDNDRQVVENQIKHVSKLEKDAFSKEKNEREAEKHKAEKDKERMQQLQSHGSYKVQEYPGISLTPTMAEVQVKIHYVGGPAGNADYTLPESQQMAIGSKVVPLLITNYDRIQTAILNDYFSSNVEKFFKGYARRIIGKSIRYIERAIKFITGKNVELLAKANPVAREIYYSPPGFVDASSFRKRPNTPSFYNYAGAIVILDKDDITKTDQANFFENPQELKKMLKMGWNAFCILDEIDESVLFLSSLDGGLVHQIPYAYVFNTLRMDDVYKSLDTLKKHSTVFGRTIGRLPDLITKLRRESKLVKSITKVMLHEGRV
jgi:hypothetical protein